MGKSVHARGALGMVLRSPRTLGRTFPGPLHKPGQPAQPGFDSSSVLQENELGVVLSGVEILLYFSLLSGIISSGITKRRVPAGCCSIVWARCVALCLGFLQRVPSPY